MVGVMFGRTPVQNVLRTFGRNLEDAFVWLGKKDSAPRRNFLEENRGGLAGGRCLEIPSERSNHH